MAVKASYDLIIPEFFCFVSWDSLLTHSHWHLVFQSYFPYRFCQTRMMHFYFLLISLVVLSLLAFEQHPAVWGPIPGLVPTMLLQLQWLNISHFLSAYNNLFLSLFWWRLNVPGNAYFCFNNQSIQWFHSWHFPRQASLHSTSSQNWFFLLSYPDILLRPWGKPCVIE